MGTVAYFNKWLHLLSVIGAFGGIMFAWLVLARGARQTEDAENETMTRLWRAFGISQGIFWTVVLLTGFVNYYIVSASANKTYHALLGGKIALALVMFGLATALSHPAPAFEMLRKARAAWLVALLCLGIVIVGISAHLNMSRISGKGLERPPGMAVPPSGS